MYKLYFCWAQLFLRVQTLAAAGLFFFLSASAYAATWYVDNTATGANNGTSWANAWTSLTQVSGVSAGDTVYISGGSSGQTYSVSSWSPAAGTAGNPVVYKVGQDAGHTGMVTFSGGGGSSYLIYQAGNYYTLDGRYNGKANLTLMNYGNFPIYYGNNNNGTPRGVTYLGLIMNGGFQLSNAGNYEIGWCSLTMPDTSDHAIFLGGSYLPQGGTWGVNKIHNNTINVYRTPSGNLNGSGGNGDDGIQWGNSVDIFSNYFKALPDANYPGTQHQDFIQGDGQYIRIYANTFENSGESDIYPDITSSSHSHLWIYNNVFMLTDSSVTSATRSIDDGPDVSGATFTDHVIANNTFIGYGYMNIRMYTANTFVNSWLVNNIYMDCSAGNSIASSVNNIYNCYGGTSPNGGGIGAQVGTPAFVNYVRYSTNVDLHLTASDTKALDKGTNWPASMFTVDKSYVSRPQGIAWDIGAYEYAGANTNPVVSVSPTALSFGSVVTNTASSLTFSVRNTGGGTLTGTATVSAPFSIASGGSYSLANNQSQTVTINFNPQTLGSFANTVTFTGGGGMTTTVSGTGGGTVTPPPVVSAISQSGADIDPIVSGLQIYSGSIVQYSGSASDPTGLPLTWQWIYTVNGGSEVVYSSGAGTVSSVSYNYTTNTAGSTYIWKLRVSNGAATAESDLTVGVEAPPLPAGSLTFQASAGTITTPFVVASGYISQSVSTAVANGGQAVYSFIITNAGNYVVQAVVNAPNSGANSMYVNIDAQPQDPSMIWDILMTSGFEQRLVSWRGNGTDGNDQFVPQIFSLAAGTHQLIVVGREPNVQLQTLSILQLPPPPQNLHIVGP